MSGIEVENLVKAWGEQRAVDGVSFQVPEGALTVLLGPSGCGKSTILRLIAGLEEATAGSTRIGGRDVGRTDAARRGVSMVFQSYALFPHLSVRENILFGLRVRRVAADERRRRLDRAAALVGLADLLERKPAQLSGGQRQRVALARAIVSEQPVCLMDEPLSNLDAKLRAEMRDEIRDLQRRLGLTMVYVTHDQTEAMTMADQVVLLRDGRVVQAGPPADLYERPATAFAARFIGMPPMNILRRDRLPPDLGGGAGGGWVGVRPEHVDLEGCGEGGGLAATVAAVDYLGAETVVRLHRNGETLMARREGRLRLDPGATVVAAWPRGRVHVFDDKGIRRDGRITAPPLPG
ncbi:MAG: ABC transporter ATP-binding protein [Hyphomicrobiales bacterium]|nr:ABC transporter ATP-binding protein [Hyphomicrobiales bacterium]MCP5372550.1 ABC transporter ATP-binding protein [Hyphomicrobiales bacterium]